MSCICSSYLTSNIWFLQNSITWMNITNHWPWQLYLFASLCSIIILIILVLHIKYSIRDGSFSYRIVETLMIVSLFLLPHLVGVDGVSNDDDDDGNNDVHLHHWYTFWVFGVLCNREEWWSQLPMAVCWGLYVNGVSVYGRDGLYASS